MEADRDPLARSAGEVMHRGAATIAPKTLATGALPPLTSAPGHTGFLDALARQAQRTALADFALPQFPVGQRRLLQRLLHPPH
jgi:hypothetical protein